MAKGKATVLLSGGIDSASCAHLLKSSGYQVSGVFLDFGQASARMERSSVHNLGKHLSIPIEIFEVASNRDYSVGELLGRNGFLIFSAILLGQCHEGLLAMGIHAGTPYFDCSPPFINEMSALVQECTSGRVSLVAPFLHWAKDDVYSFFMDAGIPLNLTYSCEAGNQVPCGECASCRDRMRLECLPSGAR